MVAAENGALPGGKVGGMADVVAHLPPALVAAGFAVDVVIPAYGVYHRRQDAELRESVCVTFGGATQQLDLYQLDTSSAGVGQWVLHHPLFSDPPGRIYHHDGAHEPFATDANLYALFSTGIAACIAAGLWQGLSVLHLHDWHAAGVLLFPEAVNGLRTVYTIHNLALQGQRPLEGHPSSFNAWFKDRACPAEAIDPRFPDCYNPMRLGINRADRIHAVSPTYARDILHTPSSFRRGGEGLETDLQRAAAEGRLHGILNGCDYPQKHPEHCSRTALFDLVERSLAQRMAASSQLATADYLASRNLAKARKSRRKCFLVTSVGRLVPQKIDLLREHVGGCPAFDAMLKAHHEDVVFIVLGTGDPACEQFMTELAGIHPNLIWLRGYDEAVGDALYDNGDLFLMPSSFEPCGISQMLAMRGGQPCLVHSTGGLCDTVQDGVSGFVFSGEDSAGAATALIQRFTEVHHLWRTNPAGYDIMRSAALRQRFEWGACARDVIRLLYV